MSHEWRIYASLNWVIIGSDNGLSRVRRQAIIWTNAGILLIGPLRKNFSEILFRIQTCSFKKLHLKTSSAKWLQWNFNQNSNMFIQEIAFENVVCKMASILSRPQWVKIHPWASNRLSAWKACQYSHLIPLEVTESIEIIAKTIDRENTMIGKTAFL